jgi:hypothetical protein
MTSLLTTLLLMVLLGLPAFVAIRLSGFFFGEAEWWRRGLAAACLLPLLIFGSAMVLAPFALLKLWPVLAFMLVLAGASLAIPRVPWRYDATEAESIKPRWQVAVAGGLAIAAFCVYLLGNYVTGTSYMSDDYAYHGPAIAGWYRTGTLNHPRVLFASYYPLNSHVITLYTILPTGDLRWTWVATGIWLLLGSASLLALTRCLPRYTLSWGLLSVAFLLINGPVSWHHFFTLTPADVSGAVAFLTAFIVSIPREGAPRREALARVTLGAMMIGFAMGTKASFASASVVGGFGLLFMSLFGPSPLPFIKRLWTSFGLIGLGAFSTGSYWFLWNWIHADNPMFPARIWKFNGPGHDRWWGETKLTYHIKEAPDNRIFKQIWDQAIDWPPMLGYLSLLGILFCIGFSAWLVWSAARRRSVNPLGHPLLWMFISATVLVIQYPFMPYSGSFDPITGHDLWINHRFIIAFFMVGVIALCWGLSSLTTAIRHPLGSQIANAVAFLVIAYILWDNFPPTGRGVANTQSVPAQFAGAAAGILIFVLPMLRAVRDALALRPVRLVAAGVLLAMVALAGAIRERILPPPYMSVIKIEWTKIIPSMIDAIDQLPPGSRIGEFSMNGWESWYLCGSRLQHEPVLLWDRGGEMIPLHEVYHSGMIDEGYPRLGIRRVGYLPNPDTFADNLRQVDMDYLFITRYLVGALDGTWPIQRPYVQAMPEFELIWADENSEIYRKLPDTASRDEDMD